MSWTRRHRFTLSLGVSDRPTVGDGCKGTGSMYVKVGVCRPIPVSEQASVGGNEQSLNQ